MDGKIILDHFQRVPVDISYALSSLASQENCDSEEYDCMQKASEYIRYLESITAVKFSESILQNKLDYWVYDSFGDVSKDEISNIGYIVEYGVEQFLKLKN